MLAAATALNFHKGSRRQDLLSHPQSNALKEIYFKDKSEEKTSHFVTDCTAAFYWIWMKWSLSAINFIKCFEISKTNESRTHREDIQPQ